MERVDESVFHWINVDWAHPALDVVMPWLSANPLFGPAVLVGMLVTLVRGGKRARLCLVAMLLSLLVVNSAVVQPLKKLVERPRPHAVIPEARVLGGRTASYSFPSSHAANWFAMATVLGAFYRRSLWGVVPVACGVSLSRVYNGMHYPVDVMAGAVLGVVSGGMSLTLIGWIWGVVGPRWFAGAHARHPRSTPPLIERLTPPGAGGTTKLTDQEWMRLGYVVVGFLLVARLTYLAAGHIELSEDEAYQWQWSKHLALSYYSKPPLIAYVQWLGTWLWGDREFGIRFFAPLISALLSWVMLRFMAAQVGAAAAVWFLVVATATPLMNAGAVLMTVDPLSVCGWVLAMVHGWKAVQEGRTRWWLLTGVWMGLGFLAKYVAWFQWLSWVLFFVLWKPARIHLKRPGPWLAWGISVLAVLPVVIWNHQHDWITLTHLGERGGLDRAWRPTVRFLGEFVGAEMGLLNPVFFVGVVWAAVCFWRLFPSDPFPRYLWCMGAPLFLFYLTYTLRARVLPNWVAPAVIPLLALAVVYWHRRAKEGLGWVRHWAVGGVIFGMALSLLAHDTDLVRKLVGQPLPARLDPLRRVRAWTEMARIVENARGQLALEGKPVFVIGDHYGTVSLLRFYMSPDRSRAGSNPEVYFLDSEVPRNQYYFWPGYRQRKGENALYVAQIKSPEGPPEQLRRAFESVTDLGVTSVAYRGQELHRLQVFACRTLR